MKKLLLAASLLSLIISCKKNENNVSTNGTVYGTYSSLNEIYQLLSVKSKFVTIDAATGGSFYGNSGTRFSFPANCFQYASGANVTGNVQIEVAEYLKKGDMVFSRVLPISNGQELISAGEFYVHGTAGGAEVFIKPGMNFQASIPQSYNTPAGMGYFSGSLNSDSSVSKVNWRPKTDSARIRYVYNNKDKVDSILMTCDSLTYINGDEYRHAVNAQTFNVTVSIPGESSFDLSSDVAAYIFIDSVNSIANLYGTMSGHTFSNVTFDKTLLHLVIYGVINKKFYGGVLAVTPVTGTTYNVTLSQVKPEDLKGQLNGLVN